MQPVSDAAGGGFREFVEVIKRMVPSNVFSSLQDNGAMLSIIFFALILGYSITRTAEPHRSRLRDLFESVVEVMMTMAKSVLGLLPYGVFALMAKVVAGTGLAPFKALLLYMLVGGRGAARPRLCDPSDRAPRPRGDLPCAGPRPCRRPCSRPSRPARLEHDPARHHGDGRGPRAREQPRVLVHPASGGDGQHGRDRALRVHRRDLPRPVLRLRRRGGPDPGPAGVRRRPRPPRERRGRGDPVRWPGDDAHHPLGPSAPGRGRRAAARRGPAARHDADRRQRLVRQLRRRGHLPFRGRGRPPSSRPAPDPFPNPPALPVHRGYNPSAMAHEDFSSTSA